MRKTLLLVLFAAFVIAGCKKQEAPAAPAEATSQTEPAAAPAAAPAETTAE